MNFLLASYIRYMESGGDHAMYVVYNDVDNTETERMLKDGYRKWKEEQKKSTL